MAEEHSSTRDRSRLEPWGWHAGWEAKYEAWSSPDRQPARVVASDRGSCLLQTAAGELRTGAGGRLETTADQGPVAAGDWVVLKAHDNDWLIEFVLPRKSQFVRQSSGRATRRQVLAANVDTVFLMTAATEDFNLRRMERYLVLAWESGARPAIVLSKVDLASNVSALVDELTAIAPGTAVHSISSLSREGLESLGPYLAPGQTVALLGSSGVGKSTLVNVLLGHELLATSSIREKDGRGRHTTTRRQLIPLPGGALVIDTPGLRELLPWDATEGLERTFSDIETLSAGCRFADCSHQQEPECAVQQALEAGALDPARFENYLKLQREQAFQARRRNEQTDHAYRQQQRRLHRMYRQVMKDKKRRRQGPE